MAKIGMMGGTFDPIHIGHLALARAAMTEYGLDRVLFMTGGNPPHKQDRQVLDGKFRHLMVKAALNGQPGFEPCDYEIKLADYSYTANTLAHLEKTYPGDEIYFILGADSLNYVDAWYQPAEIFKRCILLVFGRAGYDAEADAGRLRGQYGADIRLIHGERLAVSSTEIRALAAAGADISAYVPASVAEIIRRYQLYPDPEEPWTARLRGLLKPRRYRHSLGVRDTAEALAKRFGVDQAQARTAGILHDCAKGLDRSLQIQMCQELEIPLDRCELENPGLIHAKLGAELVKCWFGIEDPAVIEAIRWHTLGRPEMDDLAKIIYIADMIEPNRQYPGVEALRQAAFADLNRGLFACVDATIQFNLKKGALVHPNGYALRAWIKNQI